jgi:hypothetical protein
MPRRRGKRELIKNYKEASRESEIRSHNLEIAFLWENIKKENILSIFKGNSQIIIKGNLQRALHKILKLYIKVNHKSTNANEKQNALEGRVWCLVLLGTFREAEEAINDLTKSGDPSAHILLLLGILRLVTSDIYGSLQFLESSEAKAAIGIASKMNAINRDISFQNLLSTDEKSTFVIAKATKELIQNYINNKGEEWNPQEYWKKEVSINESNWDARSQLLTQFIGYFMSTNEVAERRKLVIHNGKREGIHNIHAPHSRDNARNGFGIRVQSILNSNEIAAQTLKSTDHKGQSNKSQERQNSHQTITAKRLPYRSTSPQKYREEREDIDSNKKVDFMHYQDTNRQLSLANHKIKELRQKLKAREIDNYSKQQVFDFADQTRLKNGKINNSALGKKLGITYHTAAKICKKYGIE